MAVANDLNPEEVAELATHGVDMGGGATPPTPVEEPLADDTSALPPIPVEAPVGEGADPAAPPPPAGFVPHQALHAERARASEATARAAEANRQLSILTARTNAILAQRQDAPPPLPDLATDPEAYVQELGRRTEEAQNLRAEEEHSRRVDQAIEQDEQLFLSYTPDHPAASQHYVASRVQELTMMGYMPAQVQQIMTREVREIAANSWKQQRPAAEAVYNLARARGYVVGAPAAPGTLLPAGKAAAPTAAATVAAVKAGQGAARSMSGAAGGATAAQLNAEAMLGMSDEELEAHLKLGSKGANERFRGIGG